MPPLLATELRAHEAFSDVFWPLKPDQAKVIKSATKWSTVDIAYEIHGTGPTKLVFICGLGGITKMWQAQIQDFGHDESKIYSVLVIDNRGMGDSGHPIRWYSTTNMAADVVNVLDHLGWTSERDLNIVGCSMGGMVAQELATQIPSRISSIMFLSTASKVISTEGFAHNAFIRLRGILAPDVNEDNRLLQALNSLYSHPWLDEKDDMAEDFIRGTSKIKPFPTNRDRVAAQNLAKFDDRYTRRGYLLQLLAAGMHHKTPEALREIADKVGRSRIMVAHGSADNMLTFSHGVTVAAGLGLISKNDEDLDWSAEVENTVKGWSNQVSSNWKILPNPHATSADPEQQGFNVRFIRGQGHMIGAEMRAEFKKWLVDLIARGERENAAEST